MKSEKFSMIIRNTDMYLKDAFLKLASDLGLSISNDNETKTGIEHIQLGHAISVGTSDKFHVNWARNIDYYANRGIVPVYDLTYDWNKIVTRLQEYKTEMFQCNNNCESYVFTPVTVEFTTENSDDVCIDLQSKEIKHFGETICDFDDLDLMKVDANYSNFKIGHYNVGGILITEEDIDNILEIIKENN